MANTQRTIGRRLPLSLPRRFIGDLVHFARKIPLCTAVRPMALGELVSLRQRLAVRPAWCAIFTKAYALVAQHRPELRCAYIALPWPHLYEHPFNVASVAIEKRYHDEDAVFFGQLRGPENQSLLELDSHLKRYKSEPTEKIALFRRILKTSWWPQALRRLLWWYILSWAGEGRARHLGTFGVSTTSSLGASTLELLTPLTTALNYGTFAADGTIEVRLTYDHRVLDGCTVARAVAELEEILRGKITQELATLNVAAPFRLAVD